MEIFLISVSIFSCCLSCALWINIMIQKKKLPYDCETIHKNFSYVQVLLANVCTCVCEIEYAFAYFTWLAKWFEWKKNQNDQELMDSWDLTPQSLRYPQEISCLKTKEITRGYWQPAIWRCLWCSGQSHLRLFSIYSSECLCWSD